MDHLFRPFGPFRPGRQPSNVHFGRLARGPFVFIASTMDGFFRAFNTDTGELLWQAPLPAGGQATPMTYQWKDRQYVLIAAGGHGKLGTKLGDFIVVFAL